MNDNERFEGLEKKLDKIADLLEVLISQNNNIQQTVTDHSDKNETIVEATTTVLPSEENTELAKEIPVLDNVPKIEEEKPKSNVDETIVFLNNGATEPKPNEKKDSSKQTQRVVKKIQNVSTLPKKDSILKKNNSDLEFFLGKNVFVILASLLIFIGIIFFARVLLPFLTEEVKFALMCLFSLGFTAFSYYLVQKKQNNLTISMLACGLGTIFITLLTGNLYFKFINDILLYIALLFWTMIVYFCSKYKSFLFNIIGQAGIIISLFLSMLHPGVRNDNKLFLYSMIFICVAEVLYEFLFRKTKHNYINLGTILLTLLMFSSPIFHRSAQGYGSLTIQDMFSPEKIGPFLVWVALFLYAFVKNVFANKNNQTLFSSFSLANILVFFLAFGVLSSASASSDRIVKLLHLLFLAATFIVTEKLFFSSERSLLLNAVSVVSILGIICLYHIIPNRVYISCLILTLPLIYYVYNTKTKFPKWLLISSIFIASAFNYYYVTSLGMQIFRSRFDRPSNLFDLPTIIYCITSIAFVIFLVGYFAYTEKAFEDYKDNKKHALRLFLYLLVIINSCMLFSSLISGSHNLPQWPQVALMFLFVVVQLVFKYVFPLFNKEESLSGQSTFIVYFIVNVLMSIASIYPIFFGVLYRTPFLYLLACMLLTTLFSLNSSVFLKNKDTKSAIYVGIKITILIFIVLRPFNVEPLVSIMLFLWAVACIVIGHHFSQRYLRLYALILALLSSAKLILVDISYTSSLSRAFSFIICGLLCFLISFMYNTMEKSLKKAGLSTTEDEFSQE